MRRRLIASLATLTLICVGYGCIPANAAPIARVVALTPISGGGGWLVWSVPVAGGWALEAWHGGTPIRLPVRVRPQPFDASVGSDARGRPVVVFSRCLRTPEFAQFGAASGERGGTLLEPGNGAGCRLYELAFDTGRERALPVPALRGVSDTTPSMWHGEVAFARHSPRHGAVWQVLLFSPRSRHRLLTLPHGAVPPCLRRRCGEEATSGDVEALSFRAGTVAFVWSPEGPGILGEEAWEDRVDRVSTRSGRLAGTQLGTESCTDDSGTAFEQAFPLTPLAGSLTLFPYYQRGDCYRTFATGLAAVRGEALSHATLERPLWGLASDGSSYYGIVARPGVPGMEDAKCTSASPCAIEALALPGLRRTTARPTHPFL